MNTSLDRIDCSEIFTIRELSIDGVSECFDLEDVVHADRGRFLANCHLCR